MWKSGPTLGRQPNLAELDKESEKACWESNSKTNVVLRAHPDQRFPQSLCASLTPEGLFHKVVVIICKGASGDSKGCPSRRDTRLDALKSQLHFSLSFSP